MASTIEYIIILVGYFEYKGNQVGKIYLTSTAFIFFDKNGNELHAARKQGHTPGIYVSETIAGLSYGDVLRAVIADQALYAVLADGEPLQIECAIIPQD